LREDGERKSEENQIIITKENFLSLLRVIAKKFSRVFHPAVKSIETVQPRTIQ